LRIKRNRKSRLRTLKSASFFIEPRNLTLMPAAYDGG
jgi:hypothetical protein